MNSLIFLPYSGSFATVQWSGWAAAGNEKKKMDNNAEAKVRVMQQLSAKGTRADYIAFGPDEVGVTGVPLVGSEPFHA